MNKITSDYAVQYVSTSLILYFSYQWKPELAFCLAMGLIVAEIKQLREK